MNLKKTNSRYRVVIGATYWTLTGVNIFSANLARSLNDLGVPAHVLLTEQKTRLVEIFDPVMEFPDDVPFRYLPVQPRDSWGAHWGALIRYLEQLAPCVYIPNADWRHSNVSSLLSDRVAIVGVVHSDDPMHYDHVHRLGDYWNAIVTVSKTVAEKTSAANPKWANKVSTIPIGVNVPAIYPERNLARDRPIKIIYHGLLNQWQKRILDLPKILEELRNRKVPAYLTIAGGGHDELKLRQEFRRLDLLSQVEFLGVVPHSRMLEILQSQDVFILTSEFEGMPNALLESMARGCVPVVTGVRSGIPEIVKDGQNGYIIPVGDISFFVDRLSELQKDDDTRVRLSREAHRTVQGNAYNSASMAASYKKLFDHLIGEIEHKKYRRHRGVLVAPPREAGGFQILPLESLEKIDGVGSFPSWIDYEDFERQVAEVRKPRWKRKISNLRKYLYLKFVKHAPVRKFEVILSLPDTSNSRVKVFSEMLVRELIKKKIPAEILLTSQQNNDENASDTKLKFAPDIPIQRLPVNETDGWGTRWGAMVAYLESKAPCIYIPNHDWAHSSIVPLLSNQVGVVAVLHKNDQASHDYVSRLGKYSNAIVVVSPEIQQDIMNSNPLVAESTTLLSYSIPLPEKFPRRNRSEESPIRILISLKESLSEASVKELSKITELLDRSSILAELTIISSAEQQEFICEPQSKTVNIAFRTPGPVSYSEILTLMSQHDVFLWTEQLCVSSDSIPEAMAFGCLPISLQNSGDCIKDGWNGYVVHDLETLVDRVKALQKDPDLFEKLSLSAYQTISKDGYMPGDMADDYLKLFKKVMNDSSQKIFRRPKGSISTPLVEIVGSHTLPSHYSYYAKWVGPFPTKNDYYDFMKQMHVLSDRKLPKWFAKGKRNIKDFVKSRIYPFRSSWRKISVKGTREKLRLLRKKIKRRISKMIL